MWQGNLMGRMFKSLSLQPPSVPHRPRFASVVNATMPQQKRGYQLAFMPLIARSAFPGMHKVADRFMGLIGHPERGQLRGSEQAGQAHRIQTNRLDSNTRADRDQGRSNDLAFKPETLHLPI